MGRPSPSMTSRSGDCAALVGDGLQLQPKYLDTLDFSYNGSMGMLAHIPKIDDDIVMSRQGFSAIVDDPAFVPSPSLELVLFSPPSCPSLMAVPGVSLRFPRGSFITMSLAAHSCLLFSPIHRTAFSFFLKVHFSSTHFIQPFTSSSSFGTSLLHCVAKRYLFRSCHDEPHIHH
jgi:hypothetical protein